ncbi:MAG: hypothetical protein ABSA76_15810 [Bacteroidales bacterium]
MKKKKTPDIEITELIMVMADMDRTFMGTIERFTRADGSKFVTGKVFVQDGDIWSMAQDESELCENLDEICRLRLDYALHQDAGMTSILFNAPFFLN